ncbi:MAG: type III pantothenate kinase [Bacteroidetes bacterium]|nr:type III pantothenate kinase [Bacteroidota bacterium]
MNVQYTTICFDLGNTLLKYAVFYGDQCKGIFILENAGIESFQKVLDKYTPQKTILSSVVNHEKSIETLLAEKSQFHKLSHESKLPFTIPIAKKETVGADRLALMSAARTIYPGMHTLVISFGSCITYNFMNASGVFLGGAISPGMEMRFKAMHTFTAKLPLINANPIFPLIGYDTRTNLLSGVMLGIRGEINYQVELYEERYSNFNAVLTGGDMRYFASHLKKKIFADPQFIYKGLYAISELNS